MCSRRAALLPSCGSPGAAQRLLMLVKAQGMPILCAMHHQCKHGLT